MARVAEKKDEPKRGRRRRPCKTEKVQEKVADLGNALELWRVHVDTLHEQDRNARVMDPGTFDRLVANIAKTKRLEAPPFCALRDEQLEIVSGHHRVRAARVADVMVIPVIVDTSGLSRSEVVAKQLAHNAIQGTDDPAILRELFGELATPEDIMESHIDPEILELPAPQPLVNVKTQFDWHVVSLLFLPASLEDFDAVMAALSGNEKKVGLCDVEILPKFRQATSAVGAAYEIHAIGAAVSKMCDIVLKKLSEDGDDSGN